MSFFPKTSPSVSFGDVEHAVLEFWKADDTFHKSVEQRRAAGAPDYVFYDGPPFATGLPHYGHILTSYIKDTVPRFHTMRGSAVDRRFGWDCHGLPVENEVEKSLGISGRAAIDEMGIAAFNEKCSQAVLTYTHEWEEVITRLGRWVDFKRDYKTMDRDYMESVLNVFKRLWDKGLVYEGEKVVPYSYGCQTVLSNFEARLDDSFRPRQDPALTIRFKLKDTKLNGDEFIIAWTTTPWTLPSNMALAVGPKIDYVLMKHTDGAYYWIAQSRLDVYTKEFEGAEEIRTVKGSELAGRIYEPLMPYFADLRAEGAFRVLEAEFVSTEDGTGIVHIAPAFGEEDYDLGQRMGVPRPCPVDEEGKFTAPVSDFAGKNVHDANKDVIKLLKEQGKVVRHETIEHNYPHCWRTDTPLIYKTVPTWYVKVTAIKDKMLELNQQINWVPNHIRDGRFGDWLANARDWAISRTRFWGAPIPIWRCDKTGEIYVPESVAELEQKCGKAIPDLHRPAIDDVTFASPAGGTYRRVTDVFDCWFESGSMPYAQVHYPFENKDWFESNFPADFIVEYIAQTRGWFYTLMILSTALFERPPFKNCICHGVVLAPDGRKMSKRLKNYPDPMEVVEKFGSDALRIALLMSPVVRGGNLAFTEESVEEALRSFTIPFWNAYHFFCSYANIDGWSPEMSTLDAGKLTTIDLYILAQVEELNTRLQKAMAEYDIVACYELLILFIDQLNNWFIRLSRRRFWTKEMDEPKRVAYSVLYDVLRQFALMSAPFTPFVSEQIYRGLTGEAQSVHLQDWPEARPEFANADLVQETLTVQSVLSLARQIREKNTIKTRQPLRHLGIAGVSKTLVQNYAEELKTEANVKEVEVIEHPEEFVAPVFRPNSKVLGPKLGKDFKNVLGAMRAGEVELLENGNAKVAGHELMPEEFDVTWQPSRADIDAATAGKVIVLLSTELTDDLRKEGIVRDVTRQVQVLRKDADLDYADRIRLVIEVADDAFTTSALEQWRDWIADETLAEEIAISPLGQNRLEQSSEFTVNDVKVAVSLKKLASVG